MLAQSDPIKRWTLYEIFFSDFISRRAKARGIELPVPTSELRRWLHNKVYTELFGVVVPKS